MCLRQETRQKSNQDEANSKENQPKWFFIYFFVQNFLSFFILTSGQKKEERKMHHCVKDYFFSGYICSISRQNLLNINSKKPVVFKTLSDFLKILYLH